MKNVFALLFGLATLIPLKASADSTFVFFRHGEKPDNASGQLTCKGLNRALKLPRVLLSRYGNPDALYASAPKRIKPAVHCARFQPLFLWRYRFLNPSYCVFTPTSPISWSRICWQKKRCL